MVVSLSIQPRPFARIHHDGRHSWVPSWTVWLPGILCTYGPSAADDPFTRLSCSLEGRIGGIDRIAEWSGSAVTIVREVRIGHVVAVLAHAHGEIEKLVLTSSEILHTETERHLVEESLAHIESRVDGSHVECPGSNGVGSRGHQVPFRIDSWIVDVESLVSQTRGELSLIHISEPTRPY